MKFNIVYKKKDNNNVIYCYELIKSYDMPKQLHYLTVSKSVQGFYFVLIYKLIRYSTFLRALL